MSNVTVTAQDDTEGKVHFVLFLTMLSQTVCLRVVQTLDRPVKNDSALTLYHTIPTFNDPNRKALENTDGKNKMLVTIRFSQSVILLSKFGKKNLQSLHVSTTLELR